jgi:hypothetical protein
MRPRVVEYQTPVRAAAPQAVAIALGLAWLQGKAIRGDNGSTRYGWPGMDTQRTKYAGYVTPPQIFTGYSARRVAGGSIRATPAALPSTTNPVTVTPLMRSLAAVSAQQLGGN